MRKTALLLSGSACLGLLALAVLLQASGCYSTTKPPIEDEPTGPAWFEDATERLGISFVQDAGPVTEVGPDGKTQDRFFMPAIVGTGVAVFDFDGDGLMDLYLLQGAGPKGARAKLYKNLGGGRFKDVSAGSGLDIDGYCQGVAVGDINNDGLPDVAVSLYGGIKL
ncbi:MAG: VCBS repeat-containing protein, partial [Gemmataceae bacterium]|nr:VCBS repeat-containing protein [Gemmataceae bacterium]